MRASNTAGCVLVALVCCGAGAQGWTAFLGADRGIDWSTAGVGTIPARTTACATLFPGATTEQINAALAHCPAEQAVVLSAGTYRISGTIHIPSHVTLRGAGADKTVLDAVGAGEAVIALGSGDVPMLPRVIEGGAVAGASDIMLGTTKGVVAGKYLAISEKNDSAFVTAVGSGGNCNWCDGGWSKDGSFARGQIVRVTAVDGNRVRIEPALYGAYTHEPFAIPFDMAAERAGVEDLQVRANQSGYEKNIALRMCAYCWVRGVESNYADGDHVAVFWGFHDEIRDSYFSNAYLHEPGMHESDIQIALKSSATLVENNIIERTHTSVMLEWGAAGSVIAYNLMTGEFDTRAPGVVVGGVDFHGAHPQFTLVEGNVMTLLFADPTWGTSSQTTMFRNWVVGTNRACPPFGGRGVANCRDAAAHFGWQAAWGVQWSYLATRGAMIGNVIGSAEMQALRTPDGRVEPQFASLEYPAKRLYDSAAAWTFGYGGTGDDGIATGCGGGKPPCHAAGGSSTYVIHGNYNNIARSTGWTPGMTRQLPPSFYRAGKPGWWGGLPFPAIGPDVTGGSGPGGHSFGNPAQGCYLKVIGGTNGGSGSPLVFNAARCYGAAGQAARR